VYDFGGVSNIDSTGVQSLVDTRQQLDRYADRQVEFHFAQILSPWIKRALVAGGFGTGNPSHRVVEVASVVPVTDAFPADSHDEEDFQRRRRKSLAVKDEENSDIQEIRNRAGNSLRIQKFCLLWRQTIPFFIWIWMMQYDLRKGRRSSRNWKNVYFNIALL
jgi:hypothetical protein